MVKETDYVCAKILRREDIEEMERILSLMISEKDKAILLYKLCDYHTLQTNLKIYKELHLEELGRLKVIEANYDKYIVMQLLPFSKNNYHTTLQEIESRLLKLKLGLKIINSDDKEYNKAEQLLRLFPNSETLKKQFSLMISHGINDRNLDKHRKALFQFNDLYDAYCRYEEENVFENIKYAESMKSYNYNYDFAKLVITEYIYRSKEVKESIKKLYEDLGINKQIFQFCVDTIKELDKDLYNKYIESCNEKKVSQHEHNVETIEDLIQAMESGVLKDGTPLTVLEFIKRVPYNTKYHFASTIEGFMKSNRISGRYAMMSYIYRNKLHVQGTMRPLNEKIIYQTKFIINGVELTNDKLKVIIDYLKLNGIPVVSKSFAIAKSMYLNSEFNEDTVRELQEQALREEKPKTLVRKNNVTK